MKLMQSVEEGASLMYNPPIASHAARYSCPLYGAMRNTCLPCWRYRMAMSCKRNVFPAPDMPSPTTLALL